MGLVWGGGGGWGAEAACSEDYGCFVLTACTRAHRDTAFRDSRLHRFEVSRHFLEIQRHAGVVMVG